MSGSTTCLISCFAAVDETAAGSLTDDLRTTAAAVTAELGHLTYEVFADVTDPTKLYVVEKWASVADARRHEHLVVTTGAVDRIAPLIAEPIITLTLRPVLVAGTAGRAEVGGPA